MARDRITSAKKDLISDKGSILLSIVRGEQMELPIVLDFITIADLNYTYEAVIIEGSNDGIGTYPTAVQPGGVEDSLDVRLCVNRGTWDAATGYNQEDVVLYSDTYYRLLSGTNRVSSTVPSADDSWVEHDPSTVYVQFPSTLGAYSQLPLPDAPSYGFFELRVSEISNPIYVSHWKPARGLIEFLFSPTQLVP